MKKQSQYASSERVKALIKFSATGILTLTMLASVTACNKPGQTTTPVDPDPKPPVVDPIDPTPTEKTVTINKIYADNFAGTSFDADIQTAQNKLANRVLENLKPQITNIKYDETTKQLEFSIAYTEDNKTKSGLMTFTAPEFFQNIRGRDAKSVVLEHAKLNSTTEIKESDVDSTKTTISSAIATVREQIATAFASIEASDITIEKEQTPQPVETISFDELIAEELGEYLGNETLLKNASKLALQQNYPDNQVFDNFKIAIEDEKLVFYLNFLTGTNQKRLSASTYKGSASEFEDLITTAINPVELINKYFADYKDKAQIEKNSKDHTDILAICQTVTENIDSQKEKLSALNYKNFTNKELARHNNTLTDEQALQFALKLGYTADEVCGVYVTASTGYGFDDQYFETGYMSGFTVSVLSKTQNTYKLDSCIVNVPHYTNSTQEDYYRYFLEGKRGEKFITRNETSTSINGIFVDFGTENASAHQKYAKVASIDEYDILLPLNFN